MGPPSRQRGRVASSHQRALLERLTVVQIDHNVKVGPLHHCQVCGSSDLALVIDVGHQPLCDSLLTRERLNEPEIYYPLRLFRCTCCTLAQLDYVVDGSTVYHENYPYRTGITKELVEYQFSMARDLTQSYGLGREARV